MLCPERLRGTCERSLLGDIAAAITSGFLKCWHRLLRNGALLGEITLPRPRRQ